MAASNRATNGRMRYLHFTLFVDYLNCAQEQDRYAVLSPVAPRHLYQDQQLWLLQDHFMHTPTKPFREYGHRTRDALTFKIAISPPSFPPSIRICVEASETRSRARIISLAEQSADSLLYHLSMYDTIRS